MSMPAIGTKKFEELSRSLDARPIGYRFIKRTFDIVMSFAVLAVLVIFWPFSLALLIMIAIQTKGFPIYVQERVGQYGRTIRVPKLRSMVVDSENVEKYLSEGQMEEWHKERKVTDDPRIVPVGTFIRKTSLDELSNFALALTGKIPQRILKTGQGGTFDSPSLFALPAKEMRTKKALFLQVKVTSGTYLRTVRNFLENLTATPAKSQATFAKRIFSPVLGLIKPVLAVSM